MITSQITLIFIAISCIPIDSIVFKSMGGNRIAFRRRLSKIKLILGSSAACFKGSSRRIDRVIRSEVVATRFDHDGVFVEFIVALDHKINPVGRSRAAKVSGFSNRSLIILINI
jgi:hypothetical protein